MSYTYIHLFFSHIDHYRVLSRVPHAIQQFFSLCFMYTKSLQLCPTLCKPMDCSPPGSSVRGILWASILEWVAISCSRISSGHRDRTHASCIGSQILYQLGHLGSTLGQLVSSAQPLSRVGLFGTPWAAAHQASLSITNSWSQSWLLNYTLGQ